MIFCFLYLFLNSFFSFITQYSSIMTNVYCLHQNLWNQKNTYLSYSINCQVVFSLAFQYSFIFQNTSLYIFILNTSMRAIYILYQEERLLKLISTCSYNKLRYSNYFIIKKLLYLILRTKYYR